MKNLISFAAGTVALAIACPVLADPGVIPVSKRYPAASPGVSQPLICYMNTVEGVTIDLALICGPLSKPVAGFSNVSIIPDPPPPTNPGGGSASGGGGGGGGGNCATASDTASDGSKCGGRAASERDGGK